MDCMKLRLTTVMLALAVTAGASDAFAQDAAWRQSITQYIESQVNNGPLKGAVVGVCAMEIDGKVIAAYNSSTRMVPASNMKLVTTGAALRAAELRADIVFKGTSAEGIFDKDPRKFPDAVMYKDITYKEAIDKRLGVMDTSAFVLCMDKQVPAIRVFKMDDLNNIYRAVMGEELGTLAHM